MFSSPDLPDPVVAVTGPTTGVAGGSLQLTCSVSVVEYLVADPTVQWSGGSVGSEDVTESDTATSGVMSERNVTFSPLHTSHGAQYTCQAEVGISSISLVKTGSGSRAVMVESEWLHHVLCEYCVDVCLSHPVPSPVVMVSGPAESELVAGSSLSLTCSIQPQGGGSVDTAATIMSSWDAPDNARNTDSTAIATSATSLDLNIASVQTVDTGVYTCSASVTDSSGSMYVMNSAPATDTVRITVSK